MDMKQVKKTAGRMEDEGERLVNGKEQTWRKTLLNVEKHEKFL